MALLYTRLKNKFGKHLSGEEKQAVAYAFKKEFLKRKDTTQVSKSLKGKAAKKTSLAHSIATLVVE